MKKLVLSFALVAFFALGNASNGFSEEIATQGTIIDMTGLDGCTFLIQLDDGSRLEADIPAEFQIDGLRVGITYIPEPRMSICMAGETVKLISITPAEL
ncbi:MAG: hypothetical protein AB7T49_17050 [Oligoflexales bacterium]